MADVVVGLFFEPLPISTILEAVDDDVEVEVNVEVVEKDDAAASVIEVDSVVADPMDSD